MIGEIGGRARSRRRSSWHATKAKKPMVGFIAGATAPAGPAHGPCRRGDLRRPRHRRGQDRGDARGRHPGRGSPGGAGQDNAQGHAGLDRRPLDAAEPEARPSEAAALPRGRESGHESRADIVPVRRQCAVHRGALCALPRTTANAVDAELAHLLRGAGRAARPTCWPRCAAPSWAPNGARRDRRGRSRRRLPAPANRNVTGDGAGACRARRQERGRDPRRHHGHVARADADPRLPRARPSRGRPRSARPECAEAASASSIPRPTASPRPTWTGRSSSTTCSACETATLRADRRIAARDLLRPDRRRVHAHPGSRPEGLDPAAHRRRIRNRTAFTADGQAHDPAAS